MKPFGIVTLMSVAASAAAPVSYARSGAATFATDKSVEQFAGCFVGAQDRARRAWAYVPRGDGGTFTNSGARDARGLYFLAVLDRGAMREIRLEGPGQVDPTVARAINQCV
jgi:hypothetical protein